MEVTAYNEKYQCTRAIKGADYVQLYNQQGDVSIKFSGITDFRGYSIEGDEWESPETNSQGDIDARLMAVESAISGTPPLVEMVEALNILLGETT